MATGEIYIDDELKWINDNERGFLVTETGAVCIHGSMEDYIYPGQGFMGFSERSDRTTLDYPIGSAFSVMAGDTLLLYTIASGKVKFYKGPKANLPSTGLVSGSYYQCTDTGEIFLATSATTLIQVGGKPLPLSVVDGKLCITYNE